MKKCECGCGGFTNIATRNSKEKGWIKNKPLRFINHHQPSWNKGLHIYLGGKRFEKGQKPWNAGLKGSQKAWNKGLTKENNPNLSHSGVKKGNRPWNYINGHVRKDRHTAMGRTEYILWRISVFVRDNRTCVQCGNKGKVEADHIKPWALYPELRYAIDNGRTLCVACHRKTETWGKRATCVS